MIGDVLRPGDPEPDEGTPLLDAKGHVEPYRRAEIGGRWDRYVAAMGPFVVAPDYAAAVAGRGGGYSIWLRARTTAAGEHWVCIHASSSAPGNPGMSWAGWDLIEDRTVILGAVPGTPAAETPSVGDPALPEPDRWIRTTNGRAPVPVWNSDIQNVIAWPDGIEAIPSGFNDYPDELEHYALAIMAAVRYARQSVAETPGGERR